MIIRAHSIRAVQTVIGTVFVFIKKKKDQKFTSVLTNISMKYNIGTLSRSFYMEDDTWTTQMKFIQSYHLIEISVREDR